MIGANVMVKVWLEVYGCSSSLSDGEIIAGIIAGKGYELASNFDEADASIIVTCVVKDATANRMVERIKRLSSKPLVVAGCMAKAEPNRIRRFSPRASIVGPNAIDRVDTALASALDGKGIILLDGSVQKVGLPKIRVNPVISMVQIGSGCLSECTFCETRIAKGRLTSYRIGDIVRQVREDVEQGCREVWLTSTDNGAYGRDIGTNLAELIKAVCSIDAEFMIRVGMMNPQYLPSMLDDLIEAYRDDKVFKFIHIPVQSGSDRVLRLMRRGHRASTFIDMVKRFRRELKLCTIATDIIVGFPSESEEDFNASIDLLLEVEPDVVNVSKYSARPGTEASRMEQLSKQVINERSRVMHDVVSRVCYSRNLAWKGWEGAVLVDELTDTGGVQGRNFAYKPIYLIKKGIVDNNYDSYSKGHNSFNNDGVNNAMRLLGSWVRVRIDRVTTHSLLGSIID
ncbi:putative threonylcarbamoyladenosine tRNA methylthiotransferase [Candidatus Nitrosocaldus cavascurensis]|uniref:tRNA-t(6)A37 methylthiotransferase n=2 Tax=Candidatus Nitrosocaldaceae TaxID=1968910 RepID=A0A2K5ARV3_9ARCH|nr:putative threonylcarbamoyladenosine tRNA methylthiotransferase [Candidatus Nitrosocaldus cavascurensis]